MYHHVPPSHGPGSHEHGRPCPPSWPPRSPFYHYPGFLHLTSSALIPHIHPRMHTLTHHQQVFVLVAKGWTITQEYFAPSEWRGIILTLSAFYMTNSILLVLQVPPSP